MKATERQRAVPRDRLRSEKQRILRQLQLDYLDLKERWHGKSEYDPWFANSVNNAKLNSVAAYYDLVPGFQSLLAANGGDLENFYHAAERVAKLPKDVRRQELRGGNY